MTWLHYVDLSGAESVCCFVSIRVSLGVSGVWEYVLIFDLTFAIVATSPNIEHTHTNVHLGLSCSPIDGPLNVNCLIYWKHVQTCYNPINSTSRTRRVNEQLVKHEWRGQGITTRDIVNEKHVRGWRIVGFLPAHLTSRPRARYKGEGGGGSRRKNERRKS